MFVDRNWVLGSLLLASMGLAVPAIAEDVATYGFNEDVVAEAVGSHFAHRFDGGQTCWVENGYVDPSSGLVARGLPGTRQFASATGNGIVYHLQPYDSNNVLRLGDDDPLIGTLGVKPGRYASIHLLTASAAGSIVGGYLYPDPVVGATLNFADGPVQVPGGILTHDWDPVNPDAPGPVPPIALVVGDRAYFTSGPNWPLSSSSWLVQSLGGSEYALYEWTIDLADLGLSGRTLESITFEDPNPAGSGTIGIFAADGTPVPEPALAGVVVVLLFLVRPVRPCA